MLIPKMLIKVGGGSKMPQTSQKAHGFLNLGPGIAA